MKKFISTFILLFAIIATASAQLNIKSSSSGSERFYRDTWASVSWNGKAFIFNSSDPNTALTLSFTLGKDKETAILTLNQILDWFEKAAKKESITFEDDGQEITLYKQDGVQIIISNGDCEFIRREYSRRITGALVGGVQYKKKEATPHFSFIQKKALVKTIEAISALSDSKYGNSAKVTVEPESQQEDTTVQPADTDSSQSAETNPNSDNIDVQPADSTAA